MLSQQVLQGLAQAGDQKMVLVVIDGLGGLPHPDTGLSELETASVPNLDRLAAKGMTGLSIPVALGITPGSGPGHLSLFGYDPVASNIGRGALSALGIGLPLAPEDVAIRINFCTLDSAGNISDRRAGRIPTELNAELVAGLTDIEAGWRCVRPGDREPASSGPRAPRRRVEHSSPGDRPAADRRSRRWRRTRWTPKPS